MFRWLRKVFGKAPPAPRAARAPATPPRPEGPVAGGASPRPGPLVLDAPRFFEGILDPAEEDILFRIERRVADDAFELPQLPAAAMRIIQLANDPRADLGRVAAAVAADPTLASELLRLANSARYGGALSIDTIDHAIMRLGLRGVRAFVYAQSLKTAVLRRGSLAEVGEAVWRQAQAVGAVARAIAGPIGIDPEKAETFGLLQDIGKVALLAMLRHEVGPGRSLRPELVARIFDLFHELAGAAMAAQWGLPEDLLAVAGCHHEFRDNPICPDLAALVSLAHKLELAIALGDVAGYQLLAAAPEMEFLGLDADARAQVLAAATRAAAEAAAADPAPVA